MVLAVAPTTALREAQEVGGFRYRTPSRVRCACVDAAASLALLALPAARLTGAPSLSATLSRLADRYTAQRNGQGMFQLQQGTGIRQQPKSLDGRHAPSV